MIITTSKKQYETLRHFDCNVIILDIVNDEYKLSISNYVKIVNDKLIVCIHQNGKTWNCGDIVPSCKLQFDNSNNFYFVVYDMETETFETVNDSKIISYGFNINILIYLFDLYETNKHKITTEPNYVGTIGHRYTSELYLCTKNMKTSNNGVYYVYTFKDIDSNVLYWQTSASDIAINNVYKVTYTVKSHEITPMLSKVTKISNCTIGE